MTPCEKLGYRVGDRFEVLYREDRDFMIGSIITLDLDDGSDCPRFTGDHDDGDGYGFKYLNTIKPIRLKPAKQALADAIHQNGGWLIAGDYNFVTSNHRGVVKFFHDKPLRNGVNLVGGSCSLAWVDLQQQLPNWHQCILSRDEYFTAYPEQVKIEVNNETEHKVEVEMKSESEMTIKVSDWHKNGELPPVGVFVDVVGNDLVYGVGESNCEVIAHVENTAVIRMSYGLGCFEFGAITPARTERDKAIDEMVKVINRYDYYGSLNFDVVASDIANAMFDEGFRKEVK